MTAVAPRIDPAFTIGPVGVADLEISATMPWLPPPDPAAASPTVHALVRVHTYPVGTVTLRPGPRGLGPAEVEGAVTAELGPEIASHLVQDGLLTSGSATPFGSADTPRCLRRRAEALAHAPAVTVIVATRDRTESLARCLDSVLATDYPHLEIVVVDNAPTSSSTAEMIASRYAERGVHYVREDRRGLAAAHNCGVQVASGSILAFTDDDVVVDRYWLAAIAEAFAQTDGVGAVTGLIQPAELRTAAQLLLERHGAFAKGFEPKIFDLQAHRPADRRFPLAAGQCGSGANMAFDARCLRQLGGFNPALGTGTVAQGGDDLAAFFAVVTAGYRLVYQPAAVVRHWHRDSDEALSRQAYGYGVGLGAYLTDACTHRPGLAIRTALGAAGTLIGPFRPGADLHRRRYVGWAPELVRLGRRGAMVGPLAYLASRWRARGTARPA